MAVLESSEMQALAGQAALHGLVSQRASDLTCRLQSPTILCMHQEPWEPVDGPTPPDRKPNPDSSDAELPKEESAARLPSPLPLPLLNWQVVEIEGEATLIEET